MHTDRHPPLAWLDEASRSGEIERLDRPPAAEVFRREYVDARRPVVLRGLVGDWPARERWTPDYLRRVCGSRMVRVESTDESETTRYDRSELVQFSEFLDGVVSSPPTRRYLTVGNIMASGPGRRVAEPPFPELSGDVRVPTLLDRRTWLVSESNLWIGYHGVRSNLHFDPLHNLLCIVSGKKRVALFHPTETPNLYPRPIAHANPLHTDIDVIHPDFERFPRFRRARYVDGLLEPGDVLYMPPGFWHYVCSEGLSIAVNFWWVRSPSLVLGAVREWIHPPVHRQAVKISVLFLRRMRASLTGGAAR